MKSMTHEHTTPRPRSTALALLLAAAAWGAATGGCQSSSPGMHSDPAADSTPAPMAPTSAPAMADMTHTLSMDEPYYASMPMGTATPAGTFKAGTKVLVMVPGMKYSKVLSEGGVTAFTATPGLQPLGKK